MEIVHISTIAQAEAWLLQRLQENKYQEGLTQQIAVELSTLLKHITSNQEVINHFTPMEIQRLINKSRSIQ